MGTILRAIVGSILGPIIMVVLVFLVLWVWLGQTIRLPGQEPDPPNLNIRLWEGGPNIQLGPTPVPRGILGIKGAPQVDLSGIITAAQGIQGVIQGTQRVCFGSDCVDTPWGSAPAPTAIPGASAPKPTGPAPAPAKPVAIPTPRPSVEEVIFFSEAITATVSQPGAQIVLGSGNPCPGFQGIVTIRSLDLLADGTLALRVQAQGTGSFCPGKDLKQTLVVGEVAHKFIRADLDGAENTFLLLFEGAPAPKAGDQLVLGASWLTKGQLSLGTLAVAQ